MTKVKWLIEQDMFDEDLDSIRRAITKLGMEYKMFKYLPFVEEQNFEKYYSPVECVIVYGSINLTKIVSRSIGWVPGVWCNRENLKCTSYYNALGKYLLNDEYVMLPYGELIRSRDFLFKVFGGEALFMRPDSPFKCFAGTTVTKHHYKENIEALGFYDVTPNELVVVSSAKKLREEWRLMIIDGRVVAGSQYREDTWFKARENFLDEVGVFAGEIAQAYVADKAFVVDIARLPTGELKLIELNSFSSSGWYLADKEAIVEAAAELAIREWEDIYGWSNWKKGETND